MAANLELTLPGWQWYRDVQAVQVVVPGARTYGDENDVTKIINLTNKYLWFALGVVAMVVLVIAWIKLITARWDEKEMKKVGSILTWLVVGVIIAIFSYLLVKLIANAF